MKIIYQISLAFLSLSVLACSNTESKSVSKPAAEAPAAAQKQQIQEEELPEIQTLTESHNIMLVRVGGDLSKVTAATKTKIQTQTVDYNASFGEYKQSVTRVKELRIKLKASGTGNAQAASELNAANQAMEQSKEKYEAVSREFSKLVEEVRGQRGHY